MKSANLKWATALAALAFLTMGGVAHAATVTVNTTGDPVDGSCPDACSVRHAVTAAVDGDTVTIPAGHYALTAGAPIQVAHAIAIAGTGVGTTTIDATDNVDADQFHNRIFTVGDGATLDLSDVTLSGGNEEADETCAFGCYKLNPTGGGALLNTETATPHLTDVEFTGNQAKVGGAVSSAGTLT